MKALSVLLTLGTASLSANVADDYVNFIRQVQKDSGVEWDVNVAQAGKQLSPSGVTEEGSLFELWCVHSSTAQEYLLDEEYVSAFLPGSIIEIETGDPYRAVPRTRVDQPFSVRINVQGIEFESAPPPVEEPELTEEELDKLAEAKKKTGEARAKAQKALDEAEADYAKKTVDAQKKYDEAVPKIEEDYAKATADAREKRDEAYAKADKDLADDLAKANEESDPVKRQKKIDEANEDYNATRAKADADYAKNTEGAEKDRTQDLAKVQQDYDKATRDAQDKYDEEIAGLQADFNKKILEISEKYGVGVSHALDLGDNAVLTGAGDDSRVMEEDKNRVLFTHMAHTYAPGAHKSLGTASATAVHEAYITTNGQMIFNFAVPNIEANDLTRASGEEVFSMVSLAGHQVDETILDSKRVQIWPIARAAISGYDPAVEYDTVPSVSIQLEDLYPASTTYLRMYHGAPTANPTDPVNISDSYVIAKDAVPQDRTLLLKRLDGYFAKDGLHTLEIIHETPFGTDILAQEGILVDRTIEFKGSIYSAE